MPINISFADLTHTGQVVAANTFPLGISFVGSFAQQELSDEVEIELFKYPDDFASYLDKKTPQIAGFSSFTWNIRLHHEYAMRLKNASPDTITIFGGPHFPDSPEEQKEFLEKFPYIDFYVEFEGEQAFVELFEALKEVDFDVVRFKAERRETPSLRYLVDGDFVQAPVVKKMTDLSVLPSPHLSGISDKFYDDLLIPMMQTTRGCPYQCTFCWEGGSFFTKIKRFPQDRVHAEINYIAERIGTTVPDFMITDANFGMFKEDMETASEILKTQKSHENQWPRTIMAATAKNHKERTIEIVKLLGDTLPPTAAVQSTDINVLSEIKRKNVSLDALVSLAQHVDTQGGQSEAEIILGIPTDTREAHFKSVSDMLDAGMTFIRMYQFMMLPGTASSSLKSRERHNIETRYRVLPRCFGRYKFRGEVFSSAEIEEISVANNTLPYQHYQDCRDLNLTVEIFHNDSIFSEIAQLLSKYGIERSEWLRVVYDIIINENDVLAELYADYRAEEKKNLWMKLVEVEEFVQEPGVIERYIDAEYGTNELYKYRALAVFEHLDTLHSIAFESARRLLDKAGVLDQRTGDYMSELSRFSNLRKQDVLNTEHVLRDRYHYDFVSILESKFTVDPFDYHHPEGIDIELLHTESQKSLIAGYIVQYTTTLIGLGRILLRANMNRLYRRAQALDGEGNILPIPTIVTDFDSADYPRLVG